VYFAFHHLSVLCPSTVFHTPCNFLGTYISEFSDAEGKLQQTTFPLVMFYLPLAGLEKGSDGHHGFVNWLLCLTFFTGWFYSHSWELTKFSIPCRNKAEVWYLFVVLATDLSWLITVCLLLSCEHPIVHCKTKDSFNLQHVPNISTSQFSVETPTERSSK